MTTKEWLGRAINIDREIEQLIGERDAAYERCLSTTTCVDDVHVSGTKDPHKFDMLGECDDKINQQIDKLHEVKQEIQDVIDRVDDALLRDLLVYRYICGWKWKRVADKLGKTLSMTKIKLHARALKAVENNIMHNI